MLEEIEGNGGDAIYIMHDITSAADWKNVVQKTLEVYGALHILVNNSDIFMAGNTEETTLEDWNKVMETNATGALLGMKYVIPETRETGEGSINNISSVS